MDAEKFIGDALTADTAVMNIVQSKANITAIMQEQKIKPPSVTFTRITTTYTNGLCISEDVSGFAYMQVNCWSKTLAEAKRLHKAVRSALLRAGAIINNMTNYRDTTLYCVSADFQIMEDE